MLFQKRRSAFTLVELLVVIGIIALLIAILLPALSKARESANKAVCASNVRQLIVATVMYCNDNHGWMPRQGGGFLANTSFPRGAVGNWQTNPTSGSYQPDGELDMLNLLVTYLKANLTQPSPTGTNVTVNGTWVWTKDTTVYTGGYFYGLRYNPPKVMICPSRISGDYYRSGYGYYSGGATNLPLKITMLPAWSRVLPASQNRGNISFGSPAIWGCRVVAAPVNYAAATGGVGETLGHWNSTKNIPAGGNVGHIDGSVSFYAYNPNYNVNNPTPHTYATDGAFNSGGVAWPSDVVCPYTQYDGSVNMTPGSLSFEIGATWGSASNFPQ